MSDSINIGEETTDAMYDAATAQYAYKTAKAATTRIQPSVTPRARSH